MHTKHFENKIKLRNCNCIKIYSRKIPIYYHKTPVTIELCFSVRSKHFFAILFTLVKLGKWY